MVRQLRQRYGRDPDALLADAGFLKTTEIDELSCGTTLYLPVRQPEDPARDPHQPLPDDSPAVAAWRIRMGTAEAKELYKDRAATAECVNAIARNRGLQRFGVRGPDKARAIALWFALAHNLIANGRSPVGRSGNLTLATLRWLGALRLELLSPHAKIRLRHLPAAAERTDSSALRPAWRPSGRFVLSLFGEVRSASSG